MPIKPDSLAESCQQHHREQFGSVSIERLCTKLLEEAGELAGTIIRDTEDRDGHNWKPAVKSELGDVLVALTVIAARYDLDLCKEAVDGSSTLSLGSGSM